jgi:uncharacterized protein YcfL
MKRILTATVLGAALALTACASSSSKIVNYRGGNYEGSIVVAKSTVELTEGGLPQARAILANKSGVTQKFEYKFVWLDSNDMPVDEEDRPWHTVSVSGHDQINVRGTAPNDKARKFQIQIRDPQGVTK